MKVSADFFEASHSVIQNFLLCMELVIRTDFVFVNLMKCKISKLCILISILSNSWEYIFGVIRIFHESKFQICVQILCDFQYYLGTIYYICNIGADYFFMNVCTVLILSRVGIYKHICFCFCNMTVYFVICAL